MANATLEGGAAAPAVLDRPVEGAGLPCVIPVLEFPTLVTYASAAHLPSGGDQFDRLNSAPVDAATQPTGVTAANDMDRAEMAVAALPPAEVPIVNVFTPGLYCRTVHIAAGVALVTRKHLVEHPFILSAGVALVEDEEGNQQVFQAPHVGVTKEGTRRKIIALQDVVWTTCHPNPTDEHDPDKIVELVTAAHDNPLLHDKADPRFRMWSRHVTPSFTNKPLNIEGKEDSP